MWCDCPPLNGDLEWQSTCDTGPRAHYWIAALIFLSLFFFFFPQDSSAFKTCETMQRWCPQSWAQCGVCSSSGLPGDVPVRPASWAMPPSAQENKQRKADHVFTALYVAVPLPSAVSLWLTSELCAFRTRINAQGHRPCSLCMHERCVALHQLIYAQCYRAFLGQSNHAFKGSAYLRSKIKVQGICP